MSEYDLGMYEKAVPDSLPLDRKMAIAKRCGYDHLEFCVDLNAERAARLDWSRDERKRWRDISWEMNLPFTTFSLSLLRRTPLGLPDRAKNQEAFDVLEKSAELARDLGSRIILINGYDVYGEPSTEETRKRFFENLPKAAEICAKYGVTAGLENAEMPFCDTVKKAADIVDRIHSPYLKIYADIANTANVNDGNAERAAEDLMCGQGRIFAMHLKDMVPGDFRYTKYGEGMVDFPRSIHAAKKLGVRIFTAELFCGGNEGYEEKAAQVCRFLRGYLDAEFRAAPIRLRDLP
jgi:L-ribulose-5-phosphate 3-epimerase